MHAPLLLVVSTMLCVSCAPDVPGRSCSEVEDCFADERCVAGSCVAAVRLLDATRSSSPLDAALVDFAQRDMLLGDAADGATARDGGKVVDSTTRPDGASDGRPSDARIPDVASAVADGTVAMDGAVVPPDGAVSTDGAVPLDGLIPSDGAISPDRAVPADGAGDLGSVDAEGEDATPGLGGADDDGAVIPDALALDVAGQMVVPDAALDAVREGTDQRD